MAIPVVLLDGFAEDDFRVAVGISIRGVEEVEAGLVAML